MLIYEYKVAGTTQQYAAIDEAVRITQFIRNKCLRRWMDDPLISDKEKSALALRPRWIRDKSAAFPRMTCSAIAPYLPKSTHLLLCSTLRLVKWLLIVRGLPLLASMRTAKTTHRARRAILNLRMITALWSTSKPDGCKIGRLRLVGNKNQQIAAFAVKQIKRVRLLKRADGYYAQFCVKADRQVEHVTTGMQVGIDVGIKYFSADSNGNTIGNPRFQKKAEKKLKRLHRRLSRTQKKAANRIKARQKLAKAYLKVQRQREDFARKTANALVSSHDLIAYEDLRIANMVRNHRLAKAINDVSWGRFLQWANYYANLHQVPIIAIAPHFTSQDCSGCGQVVKKSLSERTHTCIHCGLVLDRDNNAARNILYKALGRTVGHTETGKPARL